MRLFATLLFAGLLTGCPSAEAPPPTKGGDEKKPKADLSKPTPVEPIQPDAPVVPGTPSTESGGASELLAPPWFDIAKIEHAKVLLPKNQAQVGDSTAWSTLLELAPETTTEACITAIRTEMAKTVGDLAEAVPGDKGRMTVQGKTAGYSYTVVCGPGKAGQTTMYLSYMEL